MIQNCLIWREMAKKNLAADGGSCGTAPVSSVFNVATFNSKNFKKKLDLKHYLTRVLP